jgi:hypothetical protein
LGADLRPEGRLAFIALIGFCVFVVLNGAASFASLLRIPQTQL